jgi:ankyrin repeat protein
MTLAAVLLVGLSLGQSATPASAATNAQLLEAAKLGQAAAVKELLSAGAAVNAGDRRGFTALMWACVGGSTAVVRELIDNGAAVNGRASDGTTPLMLAATNGFLDITRALLLKGADVNAARGAVRARQLAAERGHAEVVALLEQAEGLAARLLRAAVEGNDTAVRQWLAAGAPIDATDERGATALLIAARNADLGMLQTLLARGADVGVRDATNQGIFAWAEASPSTAKYVVAFLSDHGASRDAPRRPVAAQPPQVKASLDALAVNLSRISSPSPRIRSVLQRATLALSQLQKLSVQWPAESPEDYRDNLSEEVKALEAALATPPAAGDRRSPAGAGSVEKVAAAIESIAEDLEVKLEHCNRSGGKLGGSVTVRVRTIQGSNEIRSWQVFYMPRVFEAAANASPDLFPQLSSPTEDTLVPGRYVMWVRDPASARIGERTVIKIGEGKKELTLDLPVPPPSPR